MFFVMASVTRALIPSQTVGAVPHRVHAGMGVVPAHPGIFNVAYGDQEESVWFRDGSAVDFIHQDYDRLWYAIKESAPELFIA
jgi:hypothetical protein